MQTRSFTRLFLMVFLFAMALLFVAHPAPAYAEDDPIASISLSVGNETFQEVTIGRTFQLYIFINNYRSHSIRSNSFTCTQYVGESYRVESVSRLPGIIAANSTFSSTQTVHAIKPGASEIQCALNATDTVTGQSIMITGTIHLPVVSSETRLSVNAYSSTKMATVGQTVFLTVLYTNRSQSTLSNISVGCPQLGRGIMIEGQQQNYTTLRPNESGFVQFRLKALFGSGSGLYLCKVSATVSGTSEVITVPAPPVAIGVYP